MSSTVINCWPAVLDMKTLVAYTTLSRTTLWREKFRRHIVPVQLSKKRVGFLREDVDAWLKTRRIETPQDCARVFGGRSHRGKSGGK